MRASPGQDDDGAGSGLSPNRERCMSDMNAITLAQLQKRILAAQGKEPVDLVLRGGQIADVFQGCLIKGDVAVLDGVIVGLGEYDGPTLDVSGKVICPGLMDGHLHLESTMLSPAEFARAAVGHGTTAVMVDPHEIVNILGASGLDYILSFYDRLPLDLFVLLPSCVPATGLETSGADFGPAALERYRGHPGVLGLAEVMNFPGVLAGDPGVLAKIRLFSQGVVDGHAPLLRGKGLNAYRVAGIGSDHECTELAEAQEKLARGFYLMVREGSTAKNLADLLPAVTPASLRRTMLVTDDCHPEDLWQRGHLDQLIKKAVALGCPPVAALTMATLNPAEYFRLWDRGAVAPGYQADLVVVNNLEEFQVEKVFKKGRLVAESGCLTVDCSQGPAHTLPASLRVAKLSPHSFVIPAASDTIMVIGLIPGQLLTARLVLPTPAKAGLVQADPERDLLKLAVVERHHGTGNVGLGLVQGFGLQRGALASSVAHDSHNLIVVGATDHDMWVAVRHLMDTGGGLAVVADGEVLADLPLPLAGLMSLEPLAHVAARQAAVTRASRVLGVVLPDPFMALSFLALPVIPALKLTDRGLVDVDRFDFVPLFGAD
jgi:adenine deaminase